MTGSQALIIVHPFVLRQTLSVCLYTSSRLYRGPDHHGQSKKPNSYNQGIGHGGSWGRKEANRSPVCARVFEARRCDGRVVLRRKKPLAPRMYLYRPTKERPSGALQRPANDEWHLMMILSVRHQMPHRSNAGGRRARTNIVG